MGRGRSQPEPGGGELSFVNRNRPVEEDREVAAVVDVVLPVTAPDPHRQGEALDDDVVVGPFGALAFQPDRETVVGVEHLSGRLPTRADLAFGVDPDDAGGSVLLESGVATGQRGCGAEQGSRVDIADDQLVEAGDDAQTESRRRVKRSDPP